MKDKVKKIIIPFILMVIFDLTSFYFGHGQNYAEGLSLHMGLSLISALILGPYGAIGAILGNFLCDIIRSYHPLVSVLSALIGFGTSYLGYKLWYGKYISRQVVTNPKLNNTTNVILFISIVLFCGSIYAILHGKMIYLVYPEIASLTNIIQIRFFLNYINAAFILGIIGIWISNKRNFFHIPKISKKKANKNFYRRIGLLLVLSLVLTLIVGQFIPINNQIATFELIAISLLLLIYITIPITSIIVITDYKSIPENVMNIFQLTILVIVIIGIVLSYDLILLTTIENIIPLDKNEIMLIMMALIDAILVFFIVPSIVVLRYIERKVIDPILSFSKIEEFINENEKIEFDGIIDIYSKYINEKNEIGILARSYTDLITFNNHYIENIQEIEGEKERIKAELYIATRIQAANLPTTAIENDEFYVNGYSHPAKEVGGDFFDYYELDEDNLAIVIGDASGKGVPAALLATMTQVMVKQTLQHEKDPSRVLYSINNLICENNPESMFITLWLGIYNKNTKVLTFSNAGHNPPLIHENDKFEYVDINTGIVLGVMEDYEFVNEETKLSPEIVLYTDGITDANNKTGDMYGEDGLLNFLNEFKEDVDPIKPLLSEISKFTNGAEQFDDMTLLYLKVKND